mmetsp:Transcript_72203/g.143235  ORF Transcript_72203/g.143235 Transcript_72203/m.143235 type:complete len:244 (+) Transcript_72203:1775-2506(+)
MWACSAYHASSALMMSTAVTMAPAFASSAARWLCARHHSRGSSRRPQMRRVARRRASVARGLARSRRAPRRPQRRCWLQRSTARPLPLRILPPPHRPRHLPSPLCHPSLLLLSPPPTHTQPQPKHGRPRRRPCRPPAHSPRLKCRSSLASWSSSAALLAVASPASSTHSSATFHASPAARPSPAKSLTARSAPGSQTRRSATTSSLVPPLTPRVTRQCSTRARCVMTSSCCRREMQPRSARRG